MNGDSKKRKRVIKFIYEDPCRKKAVPNGAVNVRGKYLEVQKDQILACMNLSQQEACKKLGVSLSTLKRRYYELGM
jgi:predicted DNA-binding protein (UPF0251 family)